MPKTIHVKRKFSFQFAALLLCLHCLIAYAIYLLPIEGFYRTAAILAVISHCWFKWRSQLSYRSANSVRGFDYLGNSEWRLDCTDGEFITRLSSPPIVTAWAVILEFAVAGKGLRRVLLLNDSAESETLRRLRMILRLGSNCT